MDKSWDRRIFDASHAIPILEHTRHTSNIRHPYTGSMSSRYSPQPGIRASVHHECFMDHHGSNQSLVVNKQIICWTTKFSICVAGLFIINHCFFL